MKKILIFAEFYLPGYKAGGPIRTLSNMVETMSDEFEFDIVTLDRDFLDTQAYPGIKPGVWNQMRKARVFYLHPRGISFRVLLKIMKESRHDILYLNSFFSPGFTAKPLVLARLGILPPKPVVLAPRGEFAASALARKNFKKYIYLLVARLSGLYRNIIWQASSEYEAADIRGKWDPTVPIHVALDIPFSVVNEGPAGPPEDFSKTNGAVDFSEMAGSRGNPEKLKKPSKEPGKMRILFLSRVSYMKNLTGALEILKPMAGDIDFDIYGILEDADYWAWCERLIRELPDNIRAGYKGVVPYERVRDVFSAYHFFFLPTLGENFGHAIFEALLCGCPVLISDRTSWRGLEEKKAGWDIPLEAPHRFREVLNRCVAMDQGEYGLWERHARDYGSRIMQDDRILNQNRQLFRRAERCQARRTP